MTANAEPRLIPRNVLFGNPDKTSPQLSPDGGKIAYLAPLNRVLNVWVRTIGREDDRPVTRDTDRGVRIYFWAHDGRHILYLQDVGGDENWCLYGVDVETLEVRNYTPFPNVQTRVVGTEKHFPNKILISMNKDNKALHDVYDLDLTTGGLRLVAKNTGDISQWIPDSNLNISGAVKTRPDGGEDLFIRDNENTPWRKLIGWDLKDGMENGPLRFTKDRKAIYLRDSRDSDTSRFKKMTIKDGQVQILAQDPEVDLGDVLFNPDTYEPQLVTFDKDRLRYLVLDPLIQQDLDAIAKLHAGDFFIVSRDDNDKTWIIGFSMDTESLAYYSFDRTSKKGLFLFKNRPEIDDYTLAPMEPIEFRSQDNLKIRGYITFPQGQQRSKLPLVLLVHGGPWSRENWGYHPQAQWLANRGYICLQVNFRGSTGYGKRFVNAADKEWGGAMQRDLTDAVRWAITQGYADPKRIAIYGGSYGGYAALAGAVFTPDLFMCVVDVVGPSNLLTFLKTIPPYWGVYRLEFYKRVGNPETEEKLLKSRSPLFFADRIKAPVFIAQGANDPRVNRKESEQIVAQLKMKGVDYEYLLFPDEGHGFAKPENRIKFYAACEKFLAKYLGGRFEPAAS